ncbi:MAG: zinc ribbon domain-containing protein [Actinobacteria bacterium]|nr:zinc ribbon domain-containing protein [Actinomycetota bacterium]MCG2819657.1 zinc ribbon domain-containing protein [Actinomycetes bacterium]MBU4217377.1 zinc ribbon domain-containing protein [Actinomycetota bacterium]MBU4359939.1 zinc ribbon domain-containing protein [Actinomycetota bacterium]MBU4393137.1 zinc ribbon domain-containing protein [Actinomycetota bacterium]
MPIYEYRCKGCGKRFEKLVRGSDDVSCPHCGRGEPEKMFSTFGFKSSGGFTSSTGGSCGTCSTTTCNGCSK